MNCYEGICALCIYDYKFITNTDHSFFICVTRQHEVDGKIYYRFEFVAQAPNYTRHALSAVSVGNGMVLNSQFECFKCMKSLNEKLLVDYR
jgi:hypothetical protein